jgi:hypothetical protein
VLLDGPIPFPLPRGHGRPRHVSKTNNATAKNGEVAAELRRVQRVCRAGIVAFGPVTGIAVRSSFSVFDGSDEVLREVKARYVVGLTATPQRRDGHHPITEMQLGPVRFKVDVKS